MLWSRMESHRLLLLIPYGSSPRHGTKTDMTRLWCANVHHVRFVQVTRTHKHSLRIEHSYRWLKMLLESSDSLDVKTLEIVFAAEQDELSEFNITTVTGEGLLAAFGWPKGKENDKVQLVGLDELCTFATRSCYSDSPRCDEVRVGIPQHSIV